MLVTKYNEFVYETDQYKDKSKEARRAIALYGLVGEIGSLLSAVKKTLLSEDGQQSWDQSNHEIVEEIGDVVWYCFSLAQIENAGHHVNIFISDIALLKREIGSDNERGRKLHAALDASKKDDFLKAAENFPNTQSMVFSDYQKLAFLTARTRGQELLRVCLAVLWQLGAELLRKTLPEIELTLNKNVADRATNTVLGEIAWHLSAVASLYNLSLDDVVEKNVEKVNYRKVDGEVTPLHDASAKESEQFPRFLEVSFVSVGPGRSRMYLSGKQLGDDLNGNSYDDDGYRFHDVMHLANAAHLGWSPVLRKLLGKKRKSDRRTDDVEDGARAQIVEELVIKAIHSEGERLVKPSENGDAVRHFPTQSSINFRLLKSLNYFVRKLEADQNKFWEWRNAIFEGTNVFYELRKEQQGTVTVDLHGRKLTFSPDVCVDLKGAVVGLGSTTTPNTLSEEEAATVLSERELCDALANAQPYSIARMVGTKRAILDALGFKPALESHFKMIGIRILENNRVCVKANGTVRESLWNNSGLAFRVTHMEMPSILCSTAIVIADMQDVK